jgi:hypothetical protein
MPIFRAGGEFHVFAHVPKCAGTTIEAHLAERFGLLGLIGTDTGLGVSLQHLTWAQVTAVLPETWIAGSFAVVRHPLDRFVSGYNMRLSEVRPPFPRETTITDFLDWAEARLPDYPGLLDNHLRPQVDFLGPGTRVFRFEDGLGGVIAGLDETFGARPDLSPLGRHDYRHPRTERLFEVVQTLPAGVADRVTRLYAADYARFDYDPSPERPVKLKVLKPEHVRSYRRTAWHVRSLVGRTISRVRTV